MKLGLGLGIGGSGNSHPRYVTDFANGFELPGGTFTGGPTTVADNEGTLVTSPAGVLPIEGGRLVDGVWSSTDTEGAALYPSTPLRTTKGTVKKYAETYKGPLVEPARTNYFLNSTVPVTQNITTTAQQYTVSVKGTGNITLSGTATGVATDGSPLTVTATAGTLTCTVAGTLSRVNVEAGAFGTSFINTGATTVTRPAANLTRPTAGTALAALNNWATLIRFRPTAAGQTAVLWGSYTNANNATRLDLAPTTLTFTKRLGGVDYVAQASLTHAADTLYEALLYQHSVHGRGIAFRSWDGSAWSAWSTWYASTGSTNTSIAATYQNGAVNNSSHVCANLPFVEVIAIPASVEPQAWLMAQLAQGRI